MSLTLHSVSAFDLPTIVDIYFASFVQSLPVHRLIYPLGLTPSIFNTALASHKSLLKDPHVHYLKVVHSDLKGESEQLPLIDHGESSIKSDDHESTQPAGNIVAFARYNLWREDRAPGTWDAPFVINEGQLGPPEEVNLRAARTCYGRQKALTKEVVRGRRCVCRSWISNSTRHFPYHADLSALVTHPSHQHRGAGAMLARCIIDLATQEGLDIYLQATPTGYSLYCKLGFEDVAFFELDLDALGGAVEKGTGGLHRMVLMRLSIDKGDQRGREL